MRMASLLQQRLAITVLVTAGIFALLCWQHFHGGIPRHYLMQSAELPSISNAWGALILPALTWFGLGLINGRSDGSSTSLVVIGFICALLYGAVLSWCFMHGMENIAALMGPALLVIALFVPVYKPQYLMGFVFGTCLSFGAVLPTGFGLVIVLGAFLIYRGSRLVVSGLSRGSTGK